MINKITSTNNKNKYDLIERTAKFGEDIIDFAKTITPTSVTRSLIGQLVRAGTSVGANYSEANEAHSKKDFKYKISIAKKESKETMHWLRMITRADKSKNKAARKLYKEAHELVLIFSSILNKK